MVCRIKNMKTPFNKALNTTTAPNQTKVIASSLKRLSSDSAPWKCINIGRRSPKKSKVTRTSFGGTIAYKLLIVTNKMPSEKRHLYFQKYLLSRANAPIPLPRCVSLIPLGKYPYFCAKLGMFPPSDVQTCIVLACSRQPFQCASVTTSCRIISTLVILPVNRFWCSHYGCCALFIYGKHFINQRSE